MRKVEYSNKAICGFCLSVCLSIKHYIQWFRGTFQFDTHLMDVNQSWENYIVDFLPSKLLNKWCSVGKNLGTKPLDFDITEYATFFFKYIHCLLTTVVLCDEFYDRTFKLLCLN